MPCANWRNKIQTVQLFKHKKKLLQKAIFFLKHLLHLRLNLLTVHINRESGNMFYYWVLSCRPRQLYLDCLIEKFQICRTKWNIRRPYLFVFTDRYIFIYWMGLNIRDMRTTTIWIILLTENPDTVVNIWDGSILCTCPMQPSQPPLFWQWHY